MKLYVAMVGLPARGKSTLAKRIQSGLKQQGIRAAIFNNGELRRTLFGQESASAEFFNPDNKRAQRLREQISYQNMERARAWLNDGGDVAIIDATNGSVAQRVEVSATLRDRPILFVECVNDDPLLLDASIRRKTR
ncbi:MAG: 6-phosphofructo-2-kinase domain-containing protein, partial [Bilophila sp.]